MSNFPKISVVTITYGHEDYILETLGSVLMQDYPGEIEFIIANDNSPDGTDKIIKDYFHITRTPINFTIKYTKHTINKGMTTNFIWALQQASGKYIALCEGDDYWTDPLKLQKQVKILEDHQDYVLCFTNRKILENNKLTVDQPLHNNVLFHKKDIPRVYVPTLTAVFRNVVLQIPEKMQRTLIDCSLFLFLSQYGSFYYFDEPTAVYRVHGQGMYSGSSELSNLKRSTSARVVAWRSLKNIDKTALAYVITDWNRLKKDAALRDHHFISAAGSYFLHSFMELYVFKGNIIGKFKKILLKSKLQYK